MTMPLHPRLALALASVALLVSISGCDQPTASAGREAPRSVEIRAPLREIEERATLDLEVSVVGSGGDSLPASAVAWSSSNATVATVVKGRVTAWAPGSVVVTASAGSASDTVTLTVVTAVASVEVDVEEVAVAVGATKRVAVRVLDRHGEVIPRPSLRWSIADSAVVAVVEDSLLRGVRAGRTRVAVEAGALRREIAVEVRVPYTMTILPGLGGADVAPADINDLGQVFGGADAPVQPGDYWEISHPVLWRDGTVERLGFAPQALNDRGEILRGGNGDVAVWRGGAIHIVLARSPSHPTGWHSYEATALDDAGGFAGFLHTTAIGPNGYSTRTTGFLYTGGTLRELPDFAGQPLRVDRMNARGDLAGTVTLEDRTTRAFVWPAGGVPTLLSGGYTSTLADMNAAGDVVGYSLRGPGSAERAFLRTRDRTVDLGLLPGARGSRATGINDRGEIVGSAGYGDERAFLWRDGTMLDLNELVVDSEWRIVGAAGINDHGVIAAVVRHRETKAARLALLAPPR